MTSTTLITGPAGSSKSTLARLICELAKNPTGILHIDSSRCLALSRKYDTVCGKVLRNLKRDQDGGLILPGKLVVDSVLETFANFHRHFNPHHIIVAGCTRSIEEVDAWSVAVRKKLVSYRVAFIHCEDTEIEQGVQNRIAKGELRADDGSNELATRKREYTEKTLPMIDYLPKSLLIRTSRQRSLPDRMRDVIHGMDIPDHVRETWLRRLDTPTHPIHKSIREIENPASIFTEEQSVESQAEVAA